MLPRIINNGVRKHPRESIPIVSSWKPSSRERTTTDNGWSGTGKIDAHRLTRYSESEEFTNLDTVEVTIDRVGITPPPGTTGTGPKS
jgi:hypothetical protein